MMIDDVRSGLLGYPKKLPAYLFYDDVGSRLYEQITALPEYYLTRVERSILDANADDIVLQARGDDESPLTIVELGAGSAAKTEIVLRAAVARQRRCLYVPVDISAAALEQAGRRLQGAIPGLVVRPLRATHEDAFEAIGRLPRPVMAMFIGSSIGNYEDAAASELLGGLSRALDSRSWLLLGTDLRKTPERLIPAYDDSAGVTAAFNKNVLARINRELGGGFDLRLFRHAARWNDRESRIEMHLVSLEDQEVEIAALSARVHFDAGETIHTESSVKYDPARVERLLVKSGFEAQKTYHDTDRLFAVHLARAERRAGVAARKEVAA
jgi:L-histidine N-alpha-methyltransferase